MAGIPALIGRGFNTSETDGLFGRGFVVAVSGGDVTAPVLSSPTGVATGATSANGTVSTDEGNGTLWWVTTQSATGPSVAQVQAGQDHTGAAADANGSQSVSFTGVQNISATGLTGSTAYYHHYQQEDAATNDSTVVTSAQFTTDAAGSDDYELRFRDATYRRRFSWGL